MQVSNTLLILLYSYVFCFSSCFLLFARGWITIFVLWRHTQWLFNGFSCFSLCLLFRCSKSGWLLLNLSTIGIGFDGAETNCRLAHIFFDTLFGGGSRILNHESRLKKVKKSEGIMNHIISQVVNHESWTKNK